MSTVICVLARESSTRLPGKALLDLEGAPLLQRVIERVRWLGYSLVVATDGDSPGIVALCERMPQVTCFRGSPDDVLLRMLDAAELVSADTVIRVGGDTPFCDPMLMASLVAAHKAWGADYTYPTGMPAGTRSEVIDVEALARLHPTLTPSERVSDDVSGMLSRTAVQAIVALAPSQWPSVRFTVDTAEDLERARRVWRDFDGRVPGIRGLTDWWRLNEEKEARI